MSRQTHPLVISSVKRINGQAVVVVTNSVSCFVGQNLGYPMMLPLVDCTAGSPGV